MKSRHIVVVCIIVFVYIIILMIFSLIITGPGRLAVSIYSSTISHRCPLLAW